MPLTKHYIFPFVCVLWTNSFISDDERRKTQGKENYFLFFADRKMTRHWDDTGSYDSRENGPNSAPEGSELSL